MQPSPAGTLSVLAAGSVEFPGKLTLLDMEPTQARNAVRPGQNSSTDPFFPSTTRGDVHAATPVHAGDTRPVRVYAVAGDIDGSVAQRTISLTSAQRVDIRAGGDIVDFGVNVQHANAGDVSRLSAGRDITFVPSGSGRQGGTGIIVAGTGRLEVETGRNLELGTSAGIVSRGDLDNPNLPKGGADLHVAAGVGANGIDYAGSVARLKQGLQANASDDSLLWAARWLTGDDTLTASNALAAVEAVAALDADSQRTRVREMTFTALRATGRDSLNAASPYAADYTRGYATLELVFPGIGVRNNAGEFVNYQGEINLFASRIKTERGGNIEFMIPGGDLIAGLANTPESLVLTQSTGNDAGVLGLVAVAEGSSISGFARDDITVNQSRILTLGGGDVLLWSSEGDIDAGKGKKTATAIPPPVIKVDAQGNVTQELQGAATGSGIGALSTGGIAAGDVDLIAPKGTVNAGDAGIRAGNLNIAAALVLGADNISVSGTSTGTPVADTSAVTAATSGATNADGGTSDATAALASNLADAARAAEELKQAFKPTFISAEVVGHGE
jgi:hypothetical protein